MRLVGPKECWSTYNIFIFCDFLYEILSLHHCLESPLITRFEHFSAGGNVMDAHKGNQ
ncbi:hypothetical protein T11_12412 [Trichinella zimbabwensis]|uniref:Uncharacterized protein n=1 Tax=Trichinella zimbabwensis TaxID=268475 RepID=A0A0V1HLQ2_9BILA|nr:hypothetical protein T11_12412 [Trichinella zimbabwensis]